MLKKIVPLIAVLVLCFTVFVVPASAATLTNNKEYETEQEIELTGFIPEGYQYYLTHNWEYNGDWYIAFFHSQPVMEKVEHEEKNGLFYYHMTESNGSNPLYYRFSSEDDMLAYLLNNNASDVSYVYERDYISYVRLNLTNSGMSYSNFDLVFTDGSSYFKENVYTKSETIVVKDDKTYFVDKFDSAYFVNNITSEFISIVPVLIAFIVLALAMHKGISFIFGFIRNA